MVKVTPHDNLVPCVRDAYVRDHPDSDLIHDPRLARAIIRGAAQFFHLRKDAVIYSGFVCDCGLRISDCGAGSDFGIRIADCGGGAGEPADVFTINLWHEGVRVRSLVLPGLGYGGALHCETVGGRFEEVVGWDLVGALSLALGIRRWALGERGPLAKTLS